MWIIPLKEEVRKMGKFKIRNEALRVVAGAVIILTGVGLLILALYGLAEATISLGLSSWSYGQLMGVFFVCLVVMIPLIDNGKKIGDRLFNNHKG